MADGCQDAGEDPCGQHEDEKKCTKDGCQWVGKKKDAVCKSFMTLYTYASGPRCDAKRLISSLEACQESLQQLQIAEFVLQEVRELTEAVNYPPGCFYGLVNGQPAVTYNAWADATAWEEARA